MFDAALFAGKPNAALRRKAAAILAAAVRAVEPASAVRRVMSRRGESLRIGGQQYDLRRIRRILVVGAGKASAPMAAAVEAMLDRKSTRLNSSHQLISYAVF